LDENEDFLNGRRRDVDFGQIEDFEVGLGLDIGVGVVGVRVAGSGAGDTGT